MGEGAAYHSAMGTVRNSGIFAASCSRRLTVAASRTSPRSAPEECGVKPRRRKTRSSFFRASLFRRPFFFLRAHRDVSRTTSCERQAKKSGTQGLATARPGTCTRQDARRNACRARTRRPVRARRRDMTIRTTDTSERDACFRRHRGFGRLVFRRPRRSEQQASYATSWSPRAPGGQPSARMRLRERASPAPRRECVTRARR